MSNILKTKSTGGYSQDVTLEYAGNGAATAGTSFDSALNGGINQVSLPATVATAKIDPTQVKIRINSGTSPATTCIVKIQKNASADCITYTIPANSPAGTVIAPTVVAGITFVNGDILTCNLSVVCPTLDFGTYFTLIKA
jgi:hypothetical protein